MIESIEIQNFKSVGELQRIPFAPLTLLLGPNSAGKSSVMDALAAFAYATRPPRITGPINVGGRPREIDLDALRRVGAKQIDPTILRVTTAGVLDQLANRFEDSLAPYAFDDLDSRMLLAPVKLSDDIPERWRYPIEKLDLQSSVSKFLRGSASNRITVGWRSLHGLIKPHSLADFWTPKRLTGMYELWLDDRLLLLVSSNALDPWHGWVDDSNPQHHPIVILDASHPIVVSQFDRLKIDKEELQAESRFNKTNPVEVFGLHRESLREFSVDPEELLVLLHDPLTAPTIHLRDLQWTDNAIDGALDLNAWDARDKGLVEADTWGRAFEIWEQLLDCGPCKRTPDTSEECGYQIYEVNSQANKLTDLIQEWIVSLAYHAAWIRQEVSDAMSVPAVRPRVLSDIALEEQAGLSTAVTMKGSPSPRDERGWMDATSHRGMTRDSLRLASKWMSAADRLDLGVEVVVEDRIEIDPANPKIETMLRRGGSGKSVSEAIGQAGLVRSFVRFKDLRTNAVLEAAELGEGVSQVLPVACVALLDTLDPRLRFMQQPELHLHPRVEARLADLLIYGLKKSRLRKSSREFREFVVETHSEHLVLRISRRIRESSRHRVDPSVGGMMDELAAIARMRIEHAKKWHSGRTEDIQAVENFESRIDAELATWIRPDDVAVIYAEPTPEGTVYHHLRIDEDGEFIDPWPDGFFPERAEELRP